MENETNTPKVLTIDGNPDVSQVQPDELVAFHGASNPNRAILVPAGAALTADRQPVDTRNAEDGGTERLDGAVITKLGDDVMIAAGVEHDQR